MQSWTGKSHLHIAVMKQFFHNELNTELDHEMNRISRQIL